MSTDLEVIDVLDVHYHVCGTRMSQICLMSDGSVREFVVSADADGIYDGDADADADANEDCPF